MKKIFAVLALVGLSSPVLAQDAQVEQSSTTTSAEVAGAEATGYSTVAIASTAVAACCMICVLASSVEADA